VTATVAVAVADVFPSEMMYAQILACCACSRPMEAEAGVFPIEMMDTQGQACCANPKPAETGVFLSEVVEA
jgi:hypothetical protein